MSAVIFHLANILQGERDGAQGVEKWTQRETCFFILYDTQRGRQGFSRCEGTNRPLTTYLRPPNL